MPGSSTPVSAPPDTTAPRAQRRVLLCEDDALIRLSMVDMLEDAGLAVVESGSGAEALASLAARPVDILIIDVGLPDMSGIELARRLRALQPDLPLIFATGQSDLPEMRDFPRAALISKPYTVSQMEQAIASLLA